jgi:tetratricopeptide (TPR) repeat protein
VSASDGKNVAIREGEAPAQPRRRRWYRSRWLCIAAAILILLLGGYLYQHFSRSGLPPPDVDLEGIDPAVAAAVEQAGARVQQAPHSAEAWGKLGMVLLVHDFQPQAIACFDQAERLDQHEPRWPYYRALEALLRTDLQEARGKLERAAALCGDELDGPELSLAEVLLGLEDFDEAQCHFARLLETNPRHARAQLGLARVAVKRGNPRASLEPLGRAEGSPYTRQAACELLAAVHQQLGNHARAEAARRRAKELPADQNWPDMLRDDLAALRTGKANWLHQAEDHDRAGRKAEALALLQRTVRDYPDADDAWLALGRALHEQKMLEPAEAALRRAAALAPMAHEPVNELGRVLVARGNRAEAMQCFRKAIELKPNAALAWHNLGSCLAGANDHAGALEAYGKAARFAPDMFEAHFALALLRGERGQYADALVHARQAVRLKPSHPSARRLLEQIQKDHTASRPAR